MAPGMNPRTNFHFPPRNATRTNGRTSCGRNKPNANAKPASSYCPRFQSQNESAKKRTSKMESWPCPRQYHTGKKARTTKKVNEKVDRQRQNSHISSTIPASIARLSKVHITYAVSNCKYVNGRKITFS